MTVVLETYHFVKFPFVCRRATIQAGRFNFLTRICKNSPPTCPWSSSKCRSRLSLGLVQGGESFAPNITFVCVDRQQRHSHYCGHVWPIDRPYNSRALDSNRVAWITPHSRKTSKWIEILHRSISDKLVDEPDRKMYLPEVECTSMLLICKCRQVADRLRDGKYGNWIRHMERGKKAKPGYVWVQKDFIYNSGDSLVIANPTTDTNPHLTRLTIGEQIGSHL